MARPDEIGGKYENATVVFEDVTDNSEFIYRSLVKRRHTKANYVLVCHSAKVLKEYWERLDGIAVLTQLSFDSERLAANYGDDELLEEFSEAVREIPQHHYVFLDRKLQAISGLKNTRDARLPIRFLRGVAQEDEYDWVQGRVGKVMSESVDEKYRKAGREAKKYFADADTRRNRIRNILREDPELDSEEIAEELGEELTSSLTKEICLMRKEVG